MDERTPTLDKMYMVQHNDTVPCLEDDEHVGHMELHTSTTPTSKEGLKTTGFTKSVGRQLRIDSSDNCSESDKEDSRGSLNKGILSISKLFGNGVAS
jgi:hypothetical protein